MAQPLTIPKPQRDTAHPANGLRSALLWGGTGVGVLLMAGAAGLWFHYGTAVFFETIAAGFANCF